MNDALVTFVVPIYGVAKYLPGCLDSLRAQTMPDFRAILVDDGSTDGCAAICDAYAAQDARFQVIHQPNGGRSVARNAGIDACQTKWIWFVDGDDQIEPDSLARMRACMEKDCDLILLGAGKDIAPGSVRELTEADMRAFYLLAVDDTPRGIPESSQWLRAFLFAPVLYRLFRRDFVVENALRFPRDLPQGEDRVFQLHAARRLTKAVALEGHFYNYIKHEGSISFRYTDLVMDRNERLCLTVRDIVSGDEEALKRYYCYVMDNVKVCLRLNYLHRANEKPMRARRREFRAFVRRPFIREAFRECDWSLAGYKLRLFSVLCKAGSLRAIYKLYHGLFTTQVQSE